MEGKRVWAELQPHTISHPWREHAELAQGQAVCGLLFKSLGKAWHIVVWNAPDARKNMMFFVPVHSYEITGVEE